VGRREGVRTRLSYAPLISHVMHSFSHVRFPIQLVLLYRIYSPADAQGVECESEAGGGAGGALEEGTARS